MKIKSSRDLVTEALSEIKTISPQEGLEKINNNSCNLIDIRDIRELERLGRIENSSHVPRGMLEFWMDPDSQYFKDGKIDIQGSDASEFLNRVYTNAWSKLAKSHVGKIK